MIPATTAQDRRHVAAQRALPVLVALLVLAVLPACGSRLGAPISASEQGDEVLDLWRTLFWAAAALGGFVIALILLAMVRYRARSDRELPRQHRGNIPLEILYTAVPFAIAATLFALSVRTEPRTIKFNGAPELEVNVTGYQWQWRFEYPEHGVSIVGVDERDLPELVLPVDRVVRLHLQAADVQHSFFVPRFLSKKDLIPGMTNELTFRPTRKGRYLGYCTEFCGLNHSLMNYRVRVVEDDEFERWVRERRAGVRP